MPVTIDKMLDAATHAARTVMIADGGLSAPIFVLYRTDGGIIPVQVQFKTPNADLQKQLFSAWMRDKIRAEQAIGYTVASEAWLSSVEITGASTDEAMARIQADMRAGRRPSNDPKRVDCLVVAAATPKQRKGRLFTILRDARGRCRELEVLPDYDLDSPGQLSGLFAEFFETD